MDDQCVNILENWYYISQIILAIISSIIIIATFVYGLLQYMQKTKHSRISKAADLAKVYEETIINDVFVISASYKKLGIDSIVEAFNLDNMIYFTLEELNHIINEDEINKVIASISITEIVDNEIKVINPKISDNKIINDNELITYIQNLMNKMEYFCINFNSGLASDVTVYQSLHQTFFKVIKYLYIILVKVNNNKASSDKLYTNMIEVYRKWRIIYKKQQIIEEKLRLKEAKAEKKIKKIEDKMNLKKEKTKEKLKAEKQKGAIVH